MTREEYNNKMEELLRTDTYRILKKDPTAAQEAKISRILREYRKLENFRVKNISCKKMFVLKNFPSQKSTTKIKQYETF